MKLVKVFKNYQIAGRVWLLWRLLEIGRTASKRRREGRLLKGRIAVSGGLLRLPRFPLPAQLLAVFQYFPGLNGRGLSRSAPGEIRQSGDLIKGIEGCCCMGRIFIGILSGFAGLMAFTAVVQAKGPDATDYPLRVHVLKNLASARPDRGGKFAAESPGSMIGAGAADLFEGGEPMGFQFKFSCSVPLRPSEGYATYPARWKKQDKTLEVLLPERGKPWNLNPCDLQVQPRPGLAYFWDPEEDRVVEESAAKFKDWMVKHRYDPEKDLDFPLDPAPEAGGQGTGTAQPGSSSSQGPEPK